MYYFGTGGVAVDLAKARKLFETAIASGHGGAVCCLGYMHEQGKGGLEVNLVEAVRLSGARVGAMLSWDLLRVWRWGSRGEAG